MLARLCVDKDKHCPVLSIVSQYWTTEPTEQTFAPQFIFYNLFIHLIIFWGWLYSRNYLRSS